MEMPAQGPAEKAIAGAIPGPSMRVEPNLPRAISSDQELSNQFDGAVMVTALKNHPNLTMKDHEACLLTLAWPVIVPRGRQ